MDTKTKKGIALALLAAALYALNAPASKILLNYVPPTLMAGFLYIGAGLGMVVIPCFAKSAILKKTKSVLQNPSFRIQSP